MIQPNEKYQKLIRAIFNTVVDPLLIIDQDGLIIAANEATESVFGWLTDELVGQPITMLMPRHIAQQHKRYVENFLETGEEGVIGRRREVEGLHKQGQFIPISLSIGHCEFEGDHYFTGVIRDLTEEKQTQILLEQREQILEGVLNAPDEVIIVFNPQGEVVLSNDSAARALGCDPSDLIGRSWDQIIRPDVAESRINLINQAFERAETQRFMEIREGRYYENLVSPILNDSGVVELVTVFARDITSLKSSEAKLVKETKRAETANRAKTEFLSNMSHELRTPLNSVVGFAHLLSEDESLTEDQQDSISYITDAGAHLKNLIEDILDLARIEAGNLSISASSFDFSNLLLEVLDMFSQRFEMSRIRCITNDAAKGTEVFADRTRLKQVLLNFMDNAIKYNKSEGSIQIETLISDEKMLEVSFIDTGMGISEENLKSLFQPFNRLGYESSGIPGTGIGLVLSKRLVEAMNGSVQVTSEEGLGSRFTVQLPIMEGDGSDTVIATASLNTVETNTEGRQLTLLYIEDSESNIALMERFVVNHLGWEFTVSRSGLDASKVAQDLLPDVILLDINLADINGLEVALMLNASPMTQHIPIVAVTADGSEETRQACEYAGIHLVHTKPVDFIVLENILWDLTE